MTGMTEKQLRAHLKREQANGGHGLDAKGLNAYHLATPERAHAEDHKLWPHLLHDEEGHEHRWEGS